MLRFVPVLLFALAFGLGWIAGGPKFLPFILGLAALNVLVLAPDRLRQVRGDDPVGDANPLVEGAFLFIQQLVILGFAYLLGYFFANAVPLLSL